MKPHGFTNLGGRDKPDDDRDIKLGAAGVYTFPATLSDPDFFTGPIEHQGTQPACGAHAGASIKGLHKKRRFSPRFTWADIKTFDGYPIDSGTDIRAIFKSITKQGPLDFDLLGNDVSLSQHAYAHPAITAAMKTNASKYSGDGYGFMTDKSFDGLKQFLFDHGETIILLRVGKEWWTDKNGVSSWKEKDILPLRTPKVVVSGHFIVAKPYDEKYIYFKNWWGDGWGSKGYGYFGADYMPFVNDWGALFPLAFSKDLQKGMTDPDVKRLQQLLNKNPATLVSPAGPGSPGKETDFFGALTFNAVVKFQKLHNIKPTSGYVGPLTRAVLNPLVA